MFVVSSLGVGGIETYLLRFISYAIGEIEPIVLCKSGRGGALEPDYLSAGAQVYKIRLGTSLSLRYRDLYQLVRKTRIEVVCDFTGDFAALVLLTALFARIRTRIAFYRESRYQFTLTPYRLAFARTLGQLVSCLATHILSNSEVALDFFQPYWRERPQQAIVIRNPAPTPKRMETTKIAQKRMELGIPSGAFLVAHVGRVCAAKNHNIVFEVARALIQRAPDCYLLLCGQGVEDHYGHLRSKEAFGNKVQMFNHRNDVLELLASADAFLFPSINEGMPNSLIEAMAVGCPCVASAIPSIREIFPSALGNFLIAPNDSGRAVELLLEIKSGDTSSLSTTLINWTKEHFSEPETFGRFLKILCATTHTGDSNFEGVERGGGGS